MARNVQVIPAQQELKQKSVNTKNGFDIAMTPAELDELESVIQASRDEFVVEAASLLKKLRSDLSYARAHRDDVATFIQSALRAAYDIKSLGGSFNYPLMTSMAQSLHDFLAERTELTTKQYDLVGLHVDMLYLVLSRHMDGPGGTTEQQIVLALREGVRRFS